VKLSFPSSGAKEGEIKVFVVVIQRVGGSDDCRLQNRIVGVESDFFEKVFSPQSVFEKGEGR
tara:strand:+ start:409 stop:594 length:186 start_codon:yes stop_codon:yes gene_type:complete